MTSARLRTFAVIALLGPLWGCSMFGTTVKSSPLSGRPDPGKGVYLSTGGAPRAYRTLGFAQIRGYGVNVAGLTDVGDAALDGTVHRTLVDVCHQLGGDGVINIEFLDENPMTPIEKASAAASTISTSVEQGRPQVETKDRYVTVTGEIIKFMGN